MKLPFILLSLILAIISGCFTDSDDSDKDAPNIETISPDTLGITDSLLIVFDEDVDTAEIEIEKVVGDFSWLWKSEKKILIFGTNARFGQNYFSINKPVALKFRKITDKEGNITEESSSVILSFYPWYDDDFTDFSLAKADSLSSFSDYNKWVNGLSYEHTLISEGAIVGTGPKDGLVDFADYKVLIMETDDTLSVKLAYPASGDFSLTVMGPFPISSINDSLAVIEDLVKAYDLKNDDKVFKHIETSSKGVIAFTKKVESIVHNKILGERDAGAYIIRICQIELADYGFYKLHTKLGKLL
ncbi:MAG: hypothetical protein HQK83_18895 [Fibrobacteria bacterium]|nr:hypothetical protein [Fibrobacteria bacterium]